MSFGILCVRDTDAVSGEEEEKAKSIDGKTCPGNRSGNCTKAHQNKFKYFLTWKLSGQVVKICAQLTVMFVSLVLLMLNNCMEF